MLSDEEKEAIEVLNHFNPVDCGREDTQAIETILNLIKKQSKEIEELKNKNKKLQDKAKELIFEKQELTSSLLDSTPNDKIIAKIEELDYNDIGNFERRCKQEALQSLLEKE